MNRWVFLFPLFSFSSAAVAQNPLPQMDCRLTPYMVVDIGSSVFGVLEKVQVKRGDSVRRGQLLASLKSGEERAAVDLATARANFGKRQLARNEQLYADDLISIHDKDEVVTESVLSELELAVVQERLKMHSIKSPINGIVVDVSAAPGEYVQQEPLMRLAQINPISVEVVLVLEYFGRISKGMKATVTPALSDETYEAVVEVVDGVIDAASSTFGVQLKLANPGNRIPAGQNCRVLFVE